jgi:uncharacterized protein (TIGR01777 family)
MKILITGASGFVGRHLVRHCIGLGHRVTAVDLALFPETLDPDHLQVIQADTTSPGSWQDAVSGCDAVINLAGVNIFHRWSAHYKELIYDSRILTTRHLVNALPEKTSVAFCSASAVGYYGSRGDTLLDENAPAGDDFLARVCVDWEKEAMRAQSKGARVVIPRFGVVLARNGGALAKMIPAYRLFVGGPLGNGRQWFAWIHIRDLIEAMLFVIDKNDMEGPVNFCAPGQVQNNEFSRTLAARLNRPAALRVPGFMLRLAAGELGSLVLNSQRAVPQKLENAGYAFQYPSLASALGEAVG